MQCPEVIPSDPYALKLMEKNQSEKQRITSKDILPNLLTKESISESKRLNNIDGKVLRFYAIHENQDEKCEMLRKFIIHVVYLS